MRWTTYIAITYLTSVNEIERVTGLDFLSGLPAAAEDEAEQRVLPRSW